jgi:hypothetical protein
MGDVSASREYSCNKLNPLKLLKIVQKEVVFQGGNPSKIQITGDVTYEDGISENREFTIEEINVLPETYYLSGLRFKTEQFRVCMSSWDTNYRVIVFSDSRKTVLQFFDRVENDIAVMDETNHEIELENCPITNDLIRKLACDGKKLVEKDNVGVAYAKQAWHF